MDIFWTFFIAILIMLALVLSIRHRLVAWGWNFAIMAIILYVSIYHMAGRSRDAWWFSTIEGIHGEIEIVYSTVIEKKAIVLLVRKNPGEFPFYLHIPWTDNLEKQLNKAKMIADQERTPVMANADLLSKKQRGITEGMGPTQIKPQTKGEKPTDTNAPKQPPGGGDKEGGEMMFYPKPVQADPNKNYNIIEALPPAQ